MRVWPPLANLIAFKVTTYATSRCRRRHREETTNQASAVKHQGAANSLSANEQQDTWEAIRSVIYYGSISHRSKRLTGVEMSQHPASSVRTHRLSELIAGRARWLHCRSPTVSAEDFPFSNADTVGRAGSVWAPPLHFSR